MLIQQVVRALGAPFVENVFGFGSAEPRPVGVGLFRRLLSFTALLKSLQVDNIPHACLHHPTNGGRATCSRRRKWSRLASSVVIQKSPSLPLIASKNMFRSAKTKYFVLYPAPARRTSR